MDRGQKGTVFPNWIVAEEAVDPHQRWRGMTVSSFWPNTWQQTKQKNYYSFLIRAGLIFRSPLRKQSTITLQPFQSGCTNRAQKKNGLVFLLLPSFSYTYKIVLCKSIETQEISGFASRQSWGGGGRGGGGGGVGVWEKFTASAAHVEMMSSRNDQTKMEKT